MKTDFSIGYQESMVKSCTDAFFHLLKNIYKDKMQQRHVFTLSLSKINLMILKHMIHCLNFGYRKYCSRKILADRSPLIVQISILQFHECTLNIRIFLLAPN
jgi:hypothetical protein